MPDDAQSVLLRMREARWVLIVMVVVVAGFFLYHSGYRFTGTTVVRLATVTISNLPPDSSLFVDATNEELSQSGTIQLKLLPGVHTLLASAPGFWPWENIVTLSGRATTIPALLVPQHIPTQPLSPSQLREAMTVIATYSLPVETAPLSVGCTTIFTSDNRVIASSTANASCAPPAFLCLSGSCAPTIIFSPLEPIRSIVAYPGRTDALLIAAGMHVYAIGIDPREPRVFAPLYEGQAPMIVSVSDGQVVVRDTGHYAILTW